MAGKSPEPTMQGKRHLSRVSQLAGAEREAEIHYWRAKNALWLAMTKARRGGCTLGQIADASGLSRSRVQQITDPES